MSEQGDFDENASHRTYTAPYSSRHPVPTVQAYEERQEKHHAEKNVPVASKSNDQEESKLQSSIGAAKSLLHIKDTSKDDTSNQKEPYYSENRNTQSLAPPNETASEINKESVDTECPKETSEVEKNKKTSSTSEFIANELNPRQKRKNMKYMKRDAAGREVTDPITHLPITIHDSTGNELTMVPENIAPDGSGHQAPTGIDFESAQLEEQGDQLQLEHRGLEKLFPPPDFEVMRAQFANVYKLAITFGLGSVLITATVLLIVSRSINLNLPKSDHDKSSISWIRQLILPVTILIVGLGVGSGLIWVTREWLSKKIEDIWEGQMWDAARKQEQKDMDSSTPESTQWLNSLLASVWALINPDLFTSLADTLEDVMQASLPKLVRMISVEDLGQGSESIRILGIRWLPTGAAAKDVSVSGKIKSSQKEGNNDRKVPGEGEIDESSSSEGVNQVQSTDNCKQTEDNQENIAEGMEAEEGDFVNIEVAFSYRASNTGKSLRVKSKNAHLYLAFYLPGGIRFPVWVELRGILGTMRMRLQLCPDPPFFSLCTLTLLGQPKANLSCVPLMKKGLNIMDLPLISSFVQSSIDAALAEYVAPKSLTLDLKDMLVGDDFKKDTSARGVVMVRIKRATGFKEGDGGINLLKRGSSDAYVAVGWAKFGKPVWSTRVIIDDMDPVWEETAFVIVGPEELNAQELLRVQLWDSDRASADDDLGRVEVDLKQLMQRDQSGKMWDRHDGFLALDGDDEMPGSLDWSVGYFAKARIQDDQIKHQDQEPGITTIQQLKENISEDTEKKMQEVSKKDQSPEFDQQKAQDLKIRENNIIISSPPSNDYPTGIFSIQIHHITGLELEKINKNQSQGDDESDAEGAGDLPSSYCTVILNHQSVFKTRTKPKNAKPFFNAGTERLIRDWHTTEVIVSVRDSRVHENDPLLGIVYLSLARVFQKRSQVIDNFPLVGGIGYGRVRISMVFRSIQLQAPKELLGWDYGTIEIIGPITSNDVASELSGLRLKIRTTVHHGKMYSSSENGGTKWTGKKDRPVRLAVRKRYCSCLVIEFRKNSLGLDKTSAFAVLWLKDIPDDEERTLKLVVWHGDEGLRRAESNCINECGEKAGIINVPLKFWPGLSGYHQKLASKNPSMQDVFEVLDTANDNKEVEASLAEEDSDSSSDSSSSEQSHHITNGMRKKGSKLSAKILGSNEGEEDDGRRGPVDQFKDYKEHSDQLHRRHRGLMQWKGARTADWMKTKVQHGKDHVLDSFKHHDRDPGVETEV